LLSCIFVDSLQLLNMRTWRLGKVRCGQVSLHFLFSYTSQFFSSEESLQYNTFCNLFLDLLNHDFHTVSKDFLHCGRIVSQTAMLLAHILSNVPLHLSHVHNINARNFPTIQSCGNLPPNSSLRFPNSSMFITFYIIK